MNPSAVPAEPAARPGDPAAEDSGRPDPAGAPGPEVSAEAIAARLDEAADLLAAQGAEPYRVAAYRRAAEGLRAPGIDPARLARSGGRSALEALPGVGRSLSAAILQMVETGRWPFLEHLRGQADPAVLFRSVPGIGPTLARRIHEELGVETLFDLEAAAHDGRLAGLSGFGERRAAAVRGVLAERLARLRPHRIRVADEPPVAVLLDVDREYRERAARGELPRIAPRRFNPSGTAWLPVLHAERAGRHFTALYSNTALAHRLGRQGDWVVIYFEADHGAEGQRTVVTETSGLLVGRRVVRGREEECRAHYAHEADGRACAADREAAP